MSPATVIATSLTISLVGTLILYIRDLKRRHDPTNDDADFDPHIADLGRRVGGLPPFHDLEL